MSAGKKSKIYEDFKREYMVKKKDENGNFKWKLDEKIYTEETGIMFIKFMEDFKEKYDQIFANYSGEADKNEYEEIKQVVKNYLNNEDNIEACKYRTEQFWVNVEKYDDFINNYFIVDSDGNLSLKNIKDMNPNDEYYDEMMEEYEKIKKYTNEESNFLKLDPSKIKKFNLATNACEELKKRREPLFLKGSWDKIYGNKFAMTALIIIIFIGSIFQIFLTIYAVVWLISFP
jgi:hypothetical protein